MNVSELARKLRVNANELLEILPQYGFDIGKKAIKVDDRIANQIVKAWPRIRKEVDFKKRAAASAVRDEELMARAAETKEIFLPSSISVKDFAAMINIPVVDVVKRLMANGIMATINQKIDFETASIIADDFKIAVHRHGEEEGVVLVDKLKEHLDKETELSTRPPVIVIMGHVDHGKTTLLDTIRKAAVAAGEAGGITQHIGAYQIEYAGKKITFIDTPGHEAFTAMRSRGAKIADIAILVVAADDSVKPQTVEAIKIIQQAGLPMVVAVNKIDKPGAKPEKVKQDLAQLNVTSEDWGGKTIMQEISAKNNINIDKLLDTILLLAEMEHEKILANPKGPAVGTIIEAHVDKGEGPVATALIQSGLLKVGDELIINEVYYGRARALRDFKNLPTDSAGPSDPVKIIGLKYAPKVGDFLNVAGEEVDRKAKKSKDFDTHQKEESTSHAKVNEGSDEGLPTLNLIVKADTLGSLEVLLESLEKLSSAKAKIKIIKQGLGNLNDADITRAEQDKAMVLAFNVNTVSSAENLAREKNIEVYSNKIIYNLLNTAKAKLESLIKPEIVKKPLGKLKVLAVFKTEKNSMILGGEVIQGKILKDSKADVQRNGTLYETGSITQVQSGKMEVNEVSEGNQCGFKYVGSTDVKVGDLLDIYLEEIKAGKL